MDPIKVISCIYDSDVYNESSVFHGRTSELKVDPARAMKERNPEVSFFFFLISRQEYWSGLPFPSPGDLHNPEIKFLSPALQVDSLPLSHWEAVLVKRQRQLGLIRILKWYNALQEIRC